MRAVLKEVLATTGSAYSILVAEGGEPSTEQRVAMAMRAQEIGRAGGRYVPRARPQEQEGDAGAPEDAGDASGQEMDMAKAKEKAKGKAKGKAAAKAVEKKSAGTPRAESKTAKLVAAVSANGGATLKEICEASGFDERNARTTIGILRSRGGKKIELDRESGKYSLAS
jgi:hypothetical protein